MKKNLKALAVLICAAFALCFTQCSKPTEDLIVGSWNVVETVITETYNGETEVDHEDIDDGESIVFTFNNDNTLNVVSVMIDDGITETETVEGTYTIDGNKLTMTKSGYDERPETYNIETLTKQELVLSIAYTEMLDDMPYSASIKIYMKRK